MQPDTLIQSFANPQSLNRFSYVQNNPISRTDPTGHKCTPEDECDTPSGNGGPTPPIPPVNPPSGGGGSSGHSGGGHGGHEDSLLTNILNDLYHNPIFAGGQFSDGCNTWLLWNGSNFCHHTTYTSQPICIPVSLCSSQDEEWKYALRFQYPGQLPNNPVVGMGEERHVVGGDFIPDQWLRDKGAITVTIDGNKIINTTLKSHIFYQGDIERTISNGWVTTEGHGTNTSLVVAAMNQFVGPVAFQFNDFLMTSFSTLDKLSDGALLNLTNSIP